jgi:hypothetical protein
LHGEWPGTARSCMQTPTPVTPAPVRNGLVHRAIYDHKKWGFACKHAIRVATVLFGQALCMQRCQTRSGGSVAQCSATRASGSSRAGACAHHCRARRRWRRAARAASPRGSCPPGRPGARPARGRRAEPAPDPNPDPAAAAAAPARQTRRRAGTATARPPAAAAPPSHAGRRPGPAGPPGAGAPPGHGTASGPQTARRPCRGLRAGRTALACVSPPCGSRLAAARPGTTPQNWPCTAWKSPALRLPHGLAMVNRTHASVHAHTSRATGSRAIPVRRRSRAPVGARQRRRRCMANPLRPHGHPAVTGGRRPQPARTRAPGDDDARLVRARNGHGVPVHVRRRRRGVQAAAVGQHHKALAPVRDHVWDLRARRALLSDAARGA